jgi:hypothetical protein
VPSFAGKTEILTACERYERRAISRRKRALQARGTLALHASTLSSSPSPSFNQLSERLVPDPPLGKVSGASYQPDLFSWLVSFRLKSDTGTAAVFVDEFDAASNPFPAVLSATTPFTSVFCTFAASESAPLPLPHYPR